MRAPALVGIVAALHVAGIVSLVMIQGCGTTRTTTSTSAVVEPPPPPVIPPRTIPSGPAVVPSRIAMPTPVVPPAAAGGTHTIAAGETLSHLAKRYGVSSADLAEFNNLENANRIRVGQKIKIPAYAENLDAVSTVTPTELNISPPAMMGAAGGTTYVVQAGDSLSKIARLYGTRISALKSANSLTGDRILVGQKLTIPGSGDPVEGAPTVVPAEPSTPPGADRPDSGGSIEDIPFPAAPPGGSGDVEAPPDVTAGAESDQAKPLLYEVMDGDTVDEIAKLFIVSKSDILELNGLSPTDELSPGMFIKIPPDDL